MAKALLDFTPAYCLVGIYRLVTDRHVRKPVWDKCRHGIIRGAAVAGVWTFFTYKLQTDFVRLFLLRSGSSSKYGIGDHQIFGYEISLAAYATVMFMSSQITGIIRYFLSRNLAIARQRAWDQVVASRGKSLDFWGPYAEEWTKPPKVTVGGNRWEKWVGGWIMRMIIRNAIITPISILIPYAGLLFSAMIKSISMSRTLHAPYFIAKKMTPLEIAIFMQEHKFDYYTFGFCAALLESFPIIGLLFSVSNRVGAAMWAFDLEKRQDRFRKGQEKPKAPRTVVLPDGSTVDFAPSRWP
ncbi:hypothetical protein FRB95_001396 [Tulasnella sp. JGI-2019a]|nr:hypothetical protein FRB93_003673 [Tulasnella sp. JGI-2019a]KAG9032489.1 hypothetical protein FRB95_001396 [Tulasnella sp. JGI-2019a]